MTDISNYINEKLKLDKDIKVDNSVKYPSNKEEWIDFIDSYFKEWWDSDQPKSYQTNKVRSEKYYKEEYDYIIKKINTGDFNEYSHLPVKFLRYMNDKYNVKFHLS